MASASLYISLFSELFFILCIFKSFTLSLYLEFSFLEKRQFSSFFSFSFLIIFTWVYSFSEKPTISLFLLTSATSEILFSLFILSLNREILSLIGPYELEILSDFSF